MEYIKRSWTDMTPKRQRASLRECPGHPYANMGDEEFNAISVPMPIEAFWELKREKAAEFSS